MTTWVKKANHLTIHFLGPTQEPHVLFPALAGKAQCNSKELADLRDFFTVERWKREILPEINAKNLQLFFCKDSVKTKKRNTAQLEGSKSKRSKCIRSVHFIPCRVIRAKDVTSSGSKTLGHSGPWRIIKVPYSDDYLLHGLGIPQYHPITYCFLQIGLWNMLKG